MRWRIAAVLSLAIAISYFDRQTLPVAIAAIQREIPISNTQFSQLQAAFLIAYAVMYAAGGKLIDALGTRRGFLLIMVSWSLACALHGLATSVAFLALCRFLLGAGEGGGFPLATKAVAEWFPVRDRSTALGIINAGTAVGAVAAPPLIALVIAGLNWRWVFALSGAAGLVWTLWWLREYFPPAGHPRLSEPERREIGEILNPARRKDEKPQAWVSFFAYPQVWGLVFGKFLSDAGWYFYLFWLPKYLYDVRGFKTKEVGYYACIPYAASGLGCLIGGSLSSWLIRRGNSLNFSRKVALGVSAALMPLVAFITSAPVELAIVLFSIAFFGQQSWSTLMMTLPADIFPARSVGRFGSWSGGIRWSDGRRGVRPDRRLPARSRDRLQRRVPIVSTFHVLAFLLLVVTIRVVRPVAVSEAVVS